MPRMIPALVLLSAVAACGTWLNPFNWFGGDREERITIEETAIETQTDPRGLVAEVVALSVEQVPQGAVIRAMGRPPVQGFWEADLVEVERTGSAILYEFRVFPPLAPTRVSTPQSREILAGTALSNAELAGIRTIAVQAAQNRRTVSR